MRISELAAAAELSQATVKYYLREGILHPGRAVTARLAEYDETHLRRLRLIRILRDVGDVPVARLRALIQAVESDSPMHDVFGVAADALAPTSPESDRIQADTRAAVREVAEVAGWRVRPSSADMEHLALMVQTVVDYAGAVPVRDVLAPYVQAADSLARLEIAWLDEAEGRTGLLEQMVVGQVVFEKVLTALRRLAEEHYSAERFGQRPEPS